MDRTHHFPFNSFLNTLFMIQSIHAITQMGLYECGPGNSSNYLLTTFTLIPNDDIVTKVYYVNPTSNVKSCEITFVESNYTASSIFDVSQLTLNPVCDFRFNDPILTLKFRSYAVADAYTATDRYFTYSCATNAVVSSTLFTGQIVPPPNIDVPSVTLSTTYSETLEYWDGANTVTAGNLGDYVQLRFTYYHSSNKDYLDYTCGIITNCVAAGNAAYSGNVSFIDSNGCHISQDAIAINSGFVSNTSLSNSTYYYAMTPYFDLRSFKSTSIPPLSVYVQCDVTYHYGPCSFINHCKARRKREVSEGLTRTSRVRTIIFINGRESDKKPTISEAENEHIVERCLGSFTFIRTISVLSIFIAIFFGIGILMYLMEQNKAGREFTIPLQSKSFPSLQAVATASQSNKESEENI